MTIDTHSEAWRAECEARYVANMPSNEDRNTFLAGVHKHRGAAAWKQLRESVWALMRKAA